MRYVNLHNHSTFSDGDHTPEEIVLAAIEKNMLGIGFSDRLCELRMNRAKDLILGGHLSIADITQAVGFEDESHLRRRFKQFFGISIKEYRLVNKEQTLYHEKPQRK